MDLKINKNLNNKIIYIYATLPLDSFLEKQGVYLTVALPFTLKSILRQKKNYENSNISSCKNIIFQKSSYKNRPNIII